MSTTIQKGVKCLRVLADLGGTASALDVSMGAGISRTGASRLLETFAHAGLLMWDETSNRYSFGLTLYSWGAMANPMRYMVPVIRKESVRLASELDRRVDILILDGPDLMQVETNEPIDGRVTTTPSYRRTPWWNTTSGKVIAALGPPELPDKLVAAVQASGEPMEHTVSEVLDQMKLIREQEYVVASRKDTNQTSLIVPIFDSTEYAVATLAVPAAREEFTEGNQAKWLVASRAAAGRASTQLGSRRQMDLGIL
jgi:IclR family transcriptional regulator, pca regulon regulatory protein